MNKTYSNQSLGFLLNVQYQIMLLIMHLYRHASKFTKSSTKDKGFCFVLFDGNLFIL